MRIITDEHCAGYSRIGHPERPLRILGPLRLLREQTELAIEWSKPTQVSNAQILRAHSYEHLVRLEEPEDFDPDTPFYDDIGGYARASVAAALDALAAARAGENAFSLMRPPGHHATRNEAMGFCYLNNVAIAVLEAMATGAQRVAVFDFDVHHGNGTEAILLNLPGVATYSVHQHPCYPGTGAMNVGMNSFNYPVAPEERRETYRTALALAMEDMKKFQPELIAVSAGFDAYVRDPLAQSPLVLDDFYWLGQSLRELGTPFFSVLEGGYSPDLPLLILAYLKGVEGK